MTQDVFLDKQGKLTQDMRQYLAINKRKPHVIHEVYQYIYKELNTFLFMNYVNGFSTIKLLFCFVSIRIFAAIAISTVTI